MLTKTRLSETVRTTSRVGITIGVVATRQFHDDNNNDDSFHTASSHHVETTCTTGQRNDEPIRNQQNVLLFLSYSDHLD